MPVLGRGGQMKSACGTGGPGGPGGPGSGG